MGDINVGIDDSLLGGFTETERERVKRGENFAVWGWKEIARVIQKARSVAIERANRDIDPLPVEWEDNQPFIASWMAIAWRKNQRRAHKYHRDVVRSRPKKPNRNGPDRTVADANASNDLNS